MVATLLFYAAFALGEAACLVVVVNVLHGYPWRSRSTESITLVALGAVGLLSIEATRRFWLVPVAQWPVPLAAFGVACCSVALVGLPAATIARWRRPNMKDEADCRVRTIFSGAAPAEFVGEGRHSWLLRLPRNGALHLESHDWTVPFAALPAELDDLSILHLTDLHFSTAYDRRYFEAVCDAAAETPADLVLVTGDLIDDPACIDWIAPILERLPGAIGRYAILGNHDHHHDVDQIAAAVAEGGFTVLDGESTILDVGGRRLAIGGTCAPWGPGIADADVPAADFSILMSHTPDLVYRSARQGWDFILAGHNHGGQVRLPVIGPVLMPSVYSRRFDHGFFRVPPSLMYVSRGVGAKHPVRYRCTPEISRFRLVSAGDRPRRGLAEHRRAAARA